MLSSGAFFRIRFFFYRDDSAGYTHNSSSPHFSNSYSVADPSWYVDSGANYHVTLYSDDLDYVVPTGKSHLTTCNGTQSPILGIGSTSIPSATKNLMSVNKLIQLYSYILDMHSLPYNP